MACTWASSWSKLPLQLENCLCCSCRSVRALGTPWSPVKGSVADTFTWSAWGCLQPPREGSSARSVKQVSCGVEVAGQGAWAVSQDSYSFPVKPALLPFHRYFRELRQTELSFPRSKREQSRFFSHDVPMAKKNFVCWMCESSVVQRSLRCVCLLNK